MKPIEEMPHAEFAAWVSTRLREKGIDVVLSGGGCVAIYSSYLYVSSDLDFINHRFIARKHIVEAMTSLGFRQRSRYFERDGIAYLVEFPPGPLAVGDEPVRNIEELQFETGTLRLLSPTECVKDRLAGFFHWKDMQCLEQAILVSRNRTIDFYEVARWAAAERMQKEYESIKARLRPSKDGL